VKSRARLLLAALLTPAPHLLSDEPPLLPLWELGAGLATLELPQYIGSDQRIRSTIPIPYLVYRGESIKISRETFSGKLFERADLLIDLSADFSLPVDSAENKARQGMEDIDFVAEVGPALRYTLLRNSAGHRTFSIEIPLRAALQSNLRYLHYEGWRVNPRLRLQRYSGPWQLSAWAGIYWNSEAYNQLYYGVSAEQANSQRPAYAADSGYGGWALSASLSYRHARWWVGGFIRWYDINGASFQESPLALESSNAGFGLAAAWIFKSSAETVPRWE
jgi:outer membrane scaffolding protein for murein synthesis (MipA/OmpV family)